jgi:NAD(P)-dependent dehydrogenase (short-subunit alcohol dehydrogenase family)
MSWSRDDIPDLHGRVAVVTGANGGLGYETTRTLAGKGAHVVMGVRSPERAAAAREKLLRGRPDASLETAVLDLASLASVRAAAAAILAAHPVIDILVNNAGVMGIPRRLTADGHEMQLAVGHLGHFALTALLMPALLNSPAGRVVSLTSTGRWLGSTIDEADLSMERSYGPWRAYGRAKLAVAQFTVELDRRLAAAGAPVRALAADPGFARTDLQANSAREHPGLSQRFFHTTVGWVGASPAKGAEPQLRAATEPAAQGGRLYGLRFIVRGAPVPFRYLTRSMRPADLRTMWAASERATGLTFDVGSLAAAAREAATA